MPSGRPAAIILVFLVASLWIATSLPLLEPDEGRNAEVAREMIETRDWVVPHLAGMPYLDKPPGLFWAAAAAIAVAGNTPLAARLPAILAATLTLALIARAARRRGEPAFATRATLLLAGAPLFAALSPYVIFDMPLTLCVTVLWLGVAGEMDAGANARRRLLMFAALTAGVLLKGPVMLAWALGGSLATALIARSRAPLGWLAWWPGWGLMLAVAGGWFAMASARFPEYPRYAFIEESLERMTSDSFRRDQPWWFVPAVLAGGALPWSLATPWRSPAAGPHDPSDRAALGFLLFAIVFFSLSRSKLVTYLLPAIPPLAWIAARAWHAHVRRGAAVLVMIYAVLGIACASPLVLGPVRAAVDPSGLVAAGRLAAAFNVCGILAVIAFRRRWSWLTLALAVAFAPLVFLLAWPAFRSAAERQSGTPLANAIQRHAPGAGVRFELCYSPGADFALGRRSEIVSPLGFETTSTYQRRYRASLVARGLWTPRATSSPPASGTVVVRPAGRDTTPAGAIELFRDTRFVAVRMP